jgi:signal recognition particle receptor subunit beta
MANFNYETREIIAKIVYYGPSFGGKTTTLQWLYKKFDPNCIGELFSLNTEADRTLFFDLLPINLGVIKGMNLRLKIYTVPGQVKYNTTRKMVLTGVDAVVFVADSEITRYKDNLESLDNLAKNLAVKGLDINTIPLVFQYNKRDLAHVLPIAVLNEKLNFRHRPSFGSIAIDPRDPGVLESFITILRLMIASFHRKYNIVDSEEEMNRILRKLEQNFRDHIQETPDSRSGKKISV